MRHSLLVFLQMQMKKCTFKRIVILFPALLDYTTWVYPVYYMLMKSSIDLFCWNAYIHFPFKLDKKIKCWLECKSLAALSQQSTHYYNFSHNPVYFLYTLMLILSL